MVYIITFPSFLFVVWQIFTLLSCLQKSDIEPEIFIQVNNYIHC